MILLFKLKNFIKNRIFEFKVILSQLVLHHRVTISSSFFLKAFEFEINRKIEIYQQLFCYFNLFEGEKGQILKKSRSFISKILSRI